MNNKQKYTTPIVVISDNDTNITITNELESKLQTPACDPPCQLPW